MRNQNKALELLIVWIVANPKKILIVILLLLVLFSVGLTNLQISNDFRVYLSKDNPQLLAFESFENNYVKSDSATMVISAKKGDLFSQSGLTLIQEITEKAWFITDAYRVSSLSNYQYTQSSNDEISTRYLIEEANNLSQSEISQIKSIALSEPRLVQSLITKDGKLSVVVINLRLDKSQSDASLIITREMEVLRDQFRSRYPEFHIENGGSTAFNTTLARAVANDLTTLMPLSYFVIFVGLLLFLRRLSGTVSIFLLITSCLICTFGFFGWTSPMLTPIAGFAPSILLSIMVADSVHILTSYYQNRNNGKSQQTALADSLDLNFMPVLVTSITTIIGFLSLNLSSSPPYRDLGNMVAFGVLIALIFSLFLLPALLMVIPDKTKPSQNRQINFSKFSSKIVKWHRTLIILVSLLVFGLTLFVSNNKLSDNWFNYFDSSFSIVRLVKKIDGYLTGVNTLEYSFKSKTESGIFDPDYLHQLDQFEQWFLEQEKIVKVNSFSQLMKELNKTMHNDDINSYTIPTTSELAAQYLLFYEMGLPAELGLDNLITIHKDATRFSVSMTDAGSDELLAMDNRAQAWLREKAPAIQATPATGLGIVFAHIAQRNIIGLLSGTLLALIGISVLLMLVLKSFKYGLISLVPNIIPAVMAYGLWGLTYGYVDISLSIVACATLGIVVDDTVHFLHKYMLARKSGLTTVESIHNSFARVGSALLTTTVVLSNGFIILASSHMNTSATIGILMAITLLFALLVDFLLLPPLLLLLDKEQN